MAYFALRRIFEKGIERSNATVPGDDKISSRVSWWFAGSAAYPSNPSGITSFLGRGEGLIFEIWMRCFYHTSDMINLASATKYTAFWVIEYCIFVKDLVDCSATTDGSFSPYTSLGLRSSKVHMLLDIVFSVSDRSAASHPTLANFMTFVVVTLAFFNLNSRFGFCGFWPIDDS